MMDISDATRDSVVEREGFKLDIKFETREGNDEIVEDGRFWSGSDDSVSQKLKRSFDEELMNSKKRRKQLKPIKIATNIDEMVKVPKQIIGLNNDLGDDVDDLPHAVPKRLSPLLTDVQFRYPPHSETSATQKGNEIFPTMEASRFGEKPELTDLNVPNIEMGPNYITNPHFMFPLSFPSIKNAAFWSEANLKIFNQEAYCELCKKEFCNKYFLKTHKANKHGIYVDVSTGKIPTKPECKDVSPISASVRPNENGKVSGDGECAFCDLCNKKFCNKYFVKRHKTKSHGLADEDTFGFPSQETETTIVQTSANHSTKETDSSTLDAKEPLALVSKDDEVDNQKGGTAEQIKEEGEDEGPLNLIVNAKESGHEDQVKVKEEPEEEVDDCSSENIEKLQTMLLKLNPSEEFKPCNSCGENDGFHDFHQDRRQKQEKKEEYLAEVNDSSNESKLDFGGPKLDNSDSHLTKLEHPKQMKPTSSYCEICNKELCNKYFMKTHMQRMHGIEIEHGTQIGGVVCNICNKELCSKYFLRVHKQNTHGITSPSAVMGPSTSGLASGSRLDVKTSSRPEPRFPSNFTQVCYICNKRFRNPKWLQAHFLSDHVEEVSKMESNDVEESPEDESSLKCHSKSHSKASKDSKEPLGNALGLLENPAESLNVISKIFWENSIPSKLFNCSQCPFTTSVLAFLFVHERSHFVLGQDQPEMVKPSVSLQNLIHDKTFWQHKITQQIPECLDLSGEKPKYVSLEQNGS